MFAIYIKIWVTMTDGSHQFLGEKMFFLLLFNNVFNAFSDDKCATFNALFTIRLIFFLSLPYKTQLNCKRSNQFQLNKKIQMVLFFSDFRMF